MTWYAPATVMAIYGPTVVCEEPGCDIGAGTVFEGSAMIGHHCVIGENCVIGDGFWSAGNHFWASGAAKPSEIDGTTYDGDWDATPLTYAMLRTALVGLNNDLIFYALAGGLAGNAITVAYVNPGAINRPLTVTVAGTAITVNLSTGPTGLITATANAIISAIQSSPQTLVSVYRADQYGTGVVTAMPATSLAGGMEAIDIPWTIPTTIGDRCKFGPDAYIVAGTTIGDDNDFGYTPRISWYGGAEVLRTGDCYCWGKPVIGNRNAFGATCYVWNRAVIGDDNTFDGDCYIGLVYNGRWATGTGQYYSDRYHDARDFGDAKVGDRNSMKHDGYVWGAYANCASLGDDNVISFDFEIWGGHVTSGWTIGNDFWADSEQEAVYGSDPAPHYYPTIIGTPDDSWCQQGGVAP